MPRVLLTAFTSPLMIIFMMGKKKNKKTLWTTKIINYNVWILSKSSLIILYNSDELKGKSGIEKQLWICLR